MNRQVPCFFNEMGCTWRGRFGQDLEVNKHFFFFTKTQTDTIIIVNMFCSYLLLQEHLKKCQFKVNITSWV